MSQPSYQSTHKYRSGGLTVEITNGDRKLQRRKQDSGQIQVPHHGDEGKRTGPAAQRPAGIDETVWCYKYAADYIICHILARFIFSSQGEVPLTANQSVSRDGRNTRGTDERRERHRRSQDRAQE